jgi:hypothetical protein
MNYNVKEVAFDLNKTASHKIAIISNSDGYCLADQLKVRCFELG